MSLYSIYFLFLNKQVKVHPKGQDSPEFLQCCRNSRIPGIPAGISGGMKSIENDDQSETKAASGKEASKG